MLRQAGICALIAWPLLAQPKAAEVPRQLVQINVTATNGKGEPVTGLTAADFELREDGKPQPLVFFRMAGKSSMAPRVGGNTNIGSRPAQAPLVVLLDRWNESLISTAQSGLRLSAAIDKLESVDDIYVYFLDNRGELVALQALPGTTVAAKPTPAELRAKLDEAFRTLPGVRERDDFSVRVTKTFRALESLTAQMGVIPGRKTLIWLTSGFPLVIRAPLAGGVLDFTPQIRGLSEAAAQVQIAVYTVDQSTQGAGAGVGGQARAMLQLYSSLTGGRLYTSDAAAHAMDDAMVDARASYRIGYESLLKGPAQGHDGQFHKIRVETARKGVHLVTREGFASNAVAPDPGEVEMLTLSNARRSPLDAVEIGLWVGMMRGIGARTTHFEIRVDPADVFIDKSGERARAQVDVMVAVYSGGFLKDSTKTERMDLSMDAAQLAQAAKDGVSIPVNVAVGEDIQKVKVLVFDPRIQALGTVTIPLK